MGILHGDCNGSGDVDSADVFLVTQRMFTTSTTPIDLGSSATDAAAANVVMVSPVIAGKDHEHPIVH
jgi:hypothetical protein